MFFRSYNTVGVDETGVRDSTVL